MSSTSGCVLYNTTMRTVEQCRSCDYKYLEYIYSLGNQYLSDFTTDHKLPEQYPLVLVLCPNCNLLQLQHTTPSSSLYNDHYGFKSGINNTIKADLAEIVQNALLTSSILSGECVLDIGANDGTLLSNCPKEFIRVAVEPVPKLAKQAEAHADYVINDFFSAESFYSKVPSHVKAKIITSISMFYDLDRPNNFVRDIANILDKDGIWIIQQNYLVGMLTQTAFCNVVHEHLEYYSLLSLEPLLQRHGLEVFHVELNDINGGSFRTYVRHKKDQETNFSVLSLRQAERLLNLDEKKTYLNFAKKIEQVSQQLHDFIQKVTDEGKTVYAYGASTRGNTLIQTAKLNNRLVKKAIERNPDKFGKKIASLQIPIISEEQAREEKPDYLLILPWFFLKEFLKREKDYLLAGGQFIVPLPEFHIISKENLDE